MKCFKHNVADTVAVCCYCGHGLCPECLYKGAGSRAVCSNECEQALLRNENALDTILYQSKRTVQASAFYCYVCAGLSAAAAIVAWFLLPSEFLILFTGGCAVVLLLSGIWYGRAAKKQV